MAERLRIAGLGLSHDHAWSNLKDVKNCEGAELVAVADADKELLEKAEKELACPTYRSYENLLERRELDAVYIFADNANGVELAELAASHGLHVLLEKPMAATLDGADRVLAAVRQAGVRLMVNWPFAWWPHMQQAVRLVRDGAVGELWQVKYRSAHEGPREIGCSPQFCDWLYDRELNGAGAFMDYCCYGAALARALLGMPSRVFGMSARLRKEDILVDDNGLIVMTYPRAMAVVEGSWTQIGHLTAYTAAFYGSDGVLVAEPGSPGRLRLATAAKPEGDDVAFSELPPTMRNATAHFVHALASGEPFTLLCQDRVARDAQEILEAGLESAHSGSEIALPLPC
jgi:predicted dehydrogenase